MAASLNLKACLFWGVIVAVVVIACAYFAGVEPIKGAIDSAVASVSAWISSMSGNSVIDTLKNNWAGITGIAVTGVGALITYSKYMSQIKINEATTQKLQDSLRDNLSLTTAKDTAESNLAAAQKKLAIYEGDTTAESLQKTLSQTMTEKANLERQVKDVKDAFSNVMAQITQGAKEIKDPLTGEIIKIVDKIVVK